MCIGVRMCVCTCVCVHVCVCVCAFRSANHKGARSTLQQTTLRLLYKSLLQRRGVAETPLGASREVSYSSLLQRSLQIV